MVLLSFSILFQLGVNHKLANITTKFGSDKLKEEQFKLKNFLGPSIGITITGCMLTLIGVILTEILQQKEIIIQVILQFFQTLLTGIGVSIIAAVFIKWIITRHLHSLPVNSIVEALIRKTEFIRKNQKLVLTFTYEGEQIKLQKYHQYLFV